MSHFLEQAKVNIDRNETEEAINNLVEHLNTDFHDAEALYMLGAQFIGKGKNGLGAALTRQALEIKTKLGKPFPEALLNLGTCFRLENKERAAEEIWQIALEQEQDPLHKARILTNMGGCYINAGNPHKAIGYYDSALALDPDNLGALYNRGLAYLELGRWQEGWQGYEAGFAAGIRRNRSYYDLPAWDGSPGKTVIVWGEQGVGDEILFASCLPDMIRDCKRVIFDCHPRLVELFKRSFPEVEIHGTRKTQSGVDWLDGCDADASICISSLPKFYRNRDEDFPGAPYLTAWQAPLPQRPLKVGISWSGGTKKTRADLRSVPLDAWVPILESMDADYYSLQYTDSAAREVCELEERHGIHLHHMPGWVQSTDYDKTASFVSSLDLVITVCTTIHHLAGALGIPCWTLVPSKPAWRYGLTGEKCPWYSSVKLIRQEGNDWDSVIQRVAHDLADF